jgi:hypothetical protein
LSAAVVIPLPDRDPSEHVASCDAGREYQPLWACQARSEITEEKTRAAVLRRLGPPWSKLNLMFNLRVSNARRRHLLKGSRTPLERSAGFNLKLSLRSCGQHLLEPQSSYSCRG